MDQHNNNSSNNTYIVDEQQQQQQYSDQDESEEMMMNQEDLRRGPWTVEEDFTLINYIALNGEGRWNSLARCAGLKRTGKSCRLRWLNYLRPDVRRGNITLEEQLLILELHTRFGNRWSKIAQHLPGRTDNEIKNYWRTRVQKHAKQLKCDVNSKQFKDTMRYLWMPRLVERIQAAAANTTAMATGRPSSSSSTTTSTTTTTTNTYPLNHNNMDNICSSQVVLPHANYNIGGSGSGSYQNVQNTPTYTPEENSSTAAVSPAVSDLTDCYNYSVNQNHNQDYFQANNTQLGYNDSLISPCGYFNQGLNFQTTEQNNPPWAAYSGDDISDNLWNVEDIWLLQQQFNNNNM